MSNPTVGAWKAVKRIGRYLKGRPRAIWRYGWQGEEEELDVYTDANWAGCKKTRKSTSGGVIMLGNHMLKAWSRTQQGITLSSAEAEVVALVKAGAEALGMLAMMRDFGAERKASLWCDATSALSLADRKGCGKLLRHIDVGLLWIQDKELKEELSFNKVPGYHNPADMLTKHVGRETSDRHTMSAGQEYKEGRASTAIKTQATGSKEKQDVVVASVVKAKRQ